MIDLTIFDEKGSFSMTSSCGTVRNHDNGLTVLVYRVKEVENLITSIRVQGTSGFISQ